MTVTAVPACPVTMRDALVELLRAGGVSGRLRAPRAASASVAASAAASCASTAAWLALGCSLAASSTPTGRELVDLALQRRSGLERRELRVERGDGVGDLALVMFDAVSAG